MEEGETMGHVKVSIVDRNGARLKAFKKRVRRHEGLVYRGVRGEDHYLLSGDVLIVCRDVFTDKFTRRPYTAFGRFMDNLKGCFRWRG